MVRMNVKGSALEYSEAGSGTPIVLVHGSPTPLLTTLPYFRSWGEHRHAEKPSLQHVD